MALTDIAMGTTVSATIYLDEDAADDNSDISDEVMDILTCLEDDVLSWRVEGSEVWQINESADAFSSSDAQGTHIITLSDELASYLAVILEVSENSGGALDPTVLPLSRLWDIGGSGERHPSDAEISAALCHIGYDRLSLSGCELSIAAGTGLDLGAVGKGIGCDLVYDRFAEDDAVTAAVVSVGGSILTYGTKPDGSAWSVAIRDPRDESGYLGILKLTGTNYISTSGDYEKYFMEDGVRYHHILDPDTGYPADSGLISVTVIADSGLLADALSTACFVLGYEESLTLLADYEAEAIFVDQDKNVYVTGELADLFTLSNE